MSDLALPSLAQSLQERDLGHLRIVARLWGLDFEAPDVRTGRQRLVPLLLAGELVQEVIGDLPGEAKNALEDLIQHGGRLPWPLFTRRYGEVREMGHAARDRQRPWRNHASLAEVLWYRALVARSFFDTPAGPEEFAYIPEDLLALIPAGSVAHAEPFGRPATPAERAHPRLASDHILDDITTLLAALRLGVTPPIPFPDVLTALVESAKFLDAHLIPLPEPTRAFLAAPRGEALAQLLRAWQASTGFNELRQIPGLRCEGEWQNDPLRARRAVLDFLASVEPGKWWSLNAFLADIRQRQPDFQRTAGDYDSWYIRDEASSEYLRGFQNWEKVDGALVRYIITGPLHRLGVLDLASAAPDGPVTAFRHSAWAKKLLRGEVPTGLPGEEKRIKVDSSARLIIPRLVARPVRYQIARFAEWDQPLDDLYRYHITPASLQRARQQGLTINHLLALLRRHAENISPSLTKALMRWEEQGVEATLENVSILRVSSPELLQNLRVSRAARFLGDPLGPTAIIVKSGAEQKVLAVLAEMGYLGLVNV